MGLEVCPYTYLYIYIYMYVFTNYIYIYIEREREESVYIYIYIFLAEMAALHSDLRQKLSRNEHWASTGITHTVTWMDFL